MSSAIPCWHGSFLNLGGAGGTNMDVILFPSHFLVWWIGRKVVDERTSGDDRVYPHHQPFKFIRVAKI